MANGNLKEVISSDEEEGEMEVLEDEIETESSDEDVETTNAATRVYLPDHQNDPNQTLECDESTYVCYHVLKTGKPCLSFDIISDSLGNDRADQYPLTMTLVGGTEVKQHGFNHLLVMKLSNLDKNKFQSEDAEEDSEEDSEGEEDDERALKCVMVHHFGSVNRVKVTDLGGKTYAGSWSGHGKVHIWNLSRALSAVNDDNIMASYVQNKETVKPVYTFSGHGHEGFAMDWSPLVPGMLATGDIKSSIHLWKPLEDGTWHVDQRSYTGHTSAVEDIQWSPSESHVMASCSADKSIRIWDIRVAPNEACMLTKDNAHDLDVNVISWNKYEPFILSGGDDGKLRVWDLRRFPDSDPICTFKYHTAPITSVEWHPTDHSVFAASAEDHILSQWDLAIERDEEQEDTSQEVLDIPPQLLFLHMGQKEIKELHWHKQMPGVLLSTAHSGLNVFRTMSV